VPAAPYHFQFEILLDSNQCSLNSKGQPQEQHSYPFSQPQVFCKTKFTKYIDLYDGRDLYTDILAGEEWVVARNLHEVISCLPEFIESSKQADD